MSTPVAVPVQREKKPVDSLFGTCFTVVPLLCCCVCVCIMCVKLVFFILYSFCCESMLRFV